MQLMDELNRPRSSPQPNVDVRPLTKLEIIELRREFISPSLSVHYSSVHPLHIVCGEGCFLYEPSGKKYLDCINNVAQVGHCHPRVVAAAQDQVRKLEAVPSPASVSLYSSHLLQHFPASLDRLLFTNSGSEANDLALRLCECVSGGTEVLVLDGAYHGHTRPLMGLSSYKARQQKYPAIQPNTRAWIVPLPDCYRGQFRGQGACKKYVQEAAQVLDQIRAADKKISCFLVEGSPGCAGQLELPPGYLAAVFQMVRAAGGLCLVDEVQTGFGRPGSSFWMYETQEIVPDIVTLGKPMGNGHPISGVVTSSSMAARYLEMEANDQPPDLYLSDPVSMAVADTVLSVIEEEGLQANALKVGSHIMSTVRLFRDKYPVIGDVRGYGLFIGVELIKESDDLLPNTDLCTNIVQRMLLEHSVLIQGDGLDNNVLKIKPPLVFSMAHANTLLQALEECLQHFSNKQTCSVHSLSQFTA